MSPVVIDYANPHQRRRKSLWHVWLLPLVALPATLGSMSWYGDEYGALVLSNFPGIGLLRLLPEEVLHSIERSPACLWILFGVNLLVLCGVGLLLDVLRVRLWMYGFVPAIFILIVVTAGAMATRVSPYVFRAARNLEPDALCVAWAWSVYLVAAGTITAILLVRLVLLVKPLTHQTPLRLAGVEERPVKRGEDNLGQHQQG